MRSILVVVALIVTTAAALAADGTRNPSTDDLDVRSWRVETIKSLGESPPPQTSVERFISEHFADGEPQAVCSFVFEDLGNEGVYRLVASVDVNGRQFCNGVLIIHKQGARFGIDSIKAWNVENVTDIIADLKKDGLKELFIPQAWSDYVGSAACTATWTRVYQWRSGQVVEVSQAFPEFYAARFYKLTGMKRSPGAVLPDSLPDTGSDRSDASSFRLMEAEKILRFLKISPTAGFDRAVQWTRSTDPTLRDKAIAVFSDIRDERSLGYLSLLTHDQDRSVAASAQIQLKVIQK